MPNIKAIQQGTNAQLIATANELYPMTAEQKVLDFTPGKELGFWSVFRPKNLFILNPGDDFRYTGYDSEEWNHVIFDPPYVTKGGHETSTIHAMNERYGMLHVEKSPRLQWELQIRPGIMEAHRLLQFDGLLWFKCMNYVTSGRVWWFSKWALNDLTKCGFVLEDEFILDGSPGPQPQFNVDGTPRVQKHARNAHSYLMIARKDRRKTHDRQQRDG